MSNWWDKAYPGAPMVKLPGFPRALYPPDAAQYGKQPSADGPDVEAYKRTVSRAGRWPWQNFDDSFTNGFAHGTGGNVKETGLAGVQRQQKIDDTGWLGKTTFNTLRSIIIPDGLPHAGEYAMDATAVKLLEDAWDEFHGAEPDPEPNGSLRQKALAKAVTQLGVTESPAGSNHTQYGTWYGVDYQPWCAIFVTWCYLMSGNCPSFVRGSRYAYVPYIVGDARANRYGLITTDDPIPGDLVCYDWGFDTVYDHVGIFERWTGSGVFDAIEGNTSYSDNSNGGEVMRRNRNRYSQGTVFVRVKE